MASDDDQQFCLRWNNFQANITSQFEALRDDEDFTDVTIACDGQKLHAHKVVLSACSPFFKELFKGNPCHHPIIFMRDVEAQHIAALIEFMYAGEVNIAQAHLSTFLKTAESLKIRGLTDTSTGLVPQDLQEDKCATEEVYKHRLERTSQDEQEKEELPSISSPLSKRQCRSESDLTDNAQIEDVGLCKRQFKMELPDYLSDGDGKDDSRQTDKIFYGPTELSGAMEIIPNTSGYSSKGETTADLNSRRFRSSENWIPFGPFSQNGACDDSLDLSRGTVRTRNKRIKLGEGIEICEDQLNSLKWNDYRKLTRGLATILFSPAELATCSVTGQKWSRAGSGERPIKPALDRAKVQAIISYVATRFPLVEISRIKQVLAYKCKENSTALKMKAVRYYGDQMNK